MAEWVTMIWDHHFWSAVAMLSAVCAGISILGEGRRMRRTRFENVGIMPWTGITVISILIGVVSLAFAIKTEFIG